MIKTVLSNDIQDLLGHRPSKTEFRSALDYLNRYVDDKTMLIDVELILRDWCNDCCKKCEGCGGYFLSELMEEKWIGTGWQYVCSDECAVELQKDYE